MLPLAFQLLKNDFFSTGAAHGTHSDSTLLHALQHSAEHSAPSQSTTAVLYLIEGETTENNAQAQHLPASRAGIHTGCRVVHVVTLHGDEALERQIHLNDFKIQVTAAAPVLEVASIQINHHEA